MLHGRTEIAGFPRKSYKTLKAMARKSAAFQRKINDIGIVQGELVSDPEIVEHFKIKVQG